MYRIILESFLVIKSLRGRESDQETCDVHTTIYEDVKRPLIGKFTEVYAHLITQRCKQTHKECKSKYKNVNDLLKYKIIVKYVYA